MSNNYIVILCTVPDKETALKISRTLVSERLAACCNIIPSLTSIYFWEGKMQEDDEHLLLIKTRSEKFHALQKRIEQIHPYQVPEILALPVVQGNESYLNWVNENVQ